MSNQISQLLLPEVEAELAITRRFVAAVPDANEEFKPHEKSMKLSRLAGHVAEMPMFTKLTLTSPPMDLAVKGEVPPHSFVDAAGNLEAFNDFAQQLIDAVKATSDETFAETWTLVYGDYPIYSGTRYNAYRSMGINHLINHRAQLGVYLRLLGIGVPKSYGPSADEQ